MVGGRGEGGTLQAGEEAAGEPLAGNGVVIRQEELQIHDHRS